MPYTICSNGRPIGTTDLAFARIGGPFRAGWFHPNPEGERLMPLLTGMTAAVHAYAERDRTVREPSATPDLIEASPLADVMEALQHTLSFELTLHHEDGSLIPTELVGLQDVERLLALVGVSFDEPDEPEELDDREWDPSDEEWDDELDRLFAQAFGPESWGRDDSGEAPEGSDEGSGEGSAGRLPEPFDEIPWDTFELETAFAEAPFEEVRPWTPEDENPRVLERYQVIVTLLEDDAIP